MTNRQKVEKIIESELNRDKNIEKFFIEKKSQNSVDVVVVTSKLEETSSKVFNLETKINRDLKTASDFKIYPVEAW